MVVIKIFNNNIFYFMQPIEIKIPQIQWFNNGEKPNEELDKLSL